MTHYNQNIYSHQYYNPRSKVAPAPSTYTNPTYDNQQKKQDPQVPEQQQLPPQTQAQGPTVQTDYTNPMFDGPPLDISQKFKDFNEKNKKLIEDEKNWSFGRINFPTILIVVLSFLALAIFITGLIMWLARGSSKSFYHNKRRYNH